MKSVVHESIQHDNLGLVATNLSGFSDKARLKQVPSATETS